MASPAIVATLTTDERILGRLNAEQQLTLLAHKMCLLDFDIVSSDALDSVEHQMLLPFPPLTVARR
jgi:hypothetical protein